MIVMMMMMMMMMRMMLMMRVVMMMASAFVVSQHDACQELRAVVADTSSLALRAASLQPCFKNGTGVA